MPRDRRDLQAPARGHRPDRVDTRGMATAAARTAHRSTTGAEYGRALRPESRHLARHDKCHGRQQAGDDRSRRIRRRHDDGDVHGAPGQANPGRSRRKRRAVARDAGVHRRGQGAGDHALPHSRYRRQDAEVSRRHENGHARGGEAGGRETAAVSYVPHVVAWNLTRRCNLRHGKGSLDDTMAALGRLRAQRLDFIIQTTATKGNRAELERIAQWSAEQGAVSFNCYFLVATGRGAGLSDLAPAAYEAILADLALWQRQYRGQMMVRAKCAPHFMRHVHILDPDSQILNYQTRCPCGTQYCRITPDGKLTPCPYLPEVAGDLRTQSFADIWRSAPLFRRLREEIGRAHV